VVLFAGMAVWWIASVFGVIHNAEKFVGHLLDSKDFHFLSWGILRATTLIGLVLVCVMVVLTVVGAAFYNVFAGLVGGVEVTIVEEDERG